MAFEVDVGVGQAQHVADDAGAVRFEQRARRLQPSRRIVVAGNDDDVELRSARAGLLQEPVKLLLRCGRRIGGIEHVAGDQERVDFLGGDGVQQPVEETLVFVSTFVIVQGLAKMPVGSVKQTHGLSLW